MLDNNLVKWQELHAHCRSRIIQREMRYSIIKREILAVQATAESGSNMAIHFT